MRKIMKIVVALALTLATLVSMLTCASAETYDHNRKVEKITEEVIGGVLTGNTISLGEVERAVGEVDCDISTKSWYRHRKTDQATLYTVTSHEFTDNSVRWHADVVYYTQLYVYMGSSSPCGEKKTVRRASASATN